MRDHVGFVRELRFFPDATPGHEVRWNYQSQSLDADARAVGDDEVAQAEERFVFLPHRNVEEGVGADDEVDAISVAVVGVAEIPDSIDGIVKLGAAEIFTCFGDRRDKMRVFGAGERDHSKSMRKRCQVLLQLVRRAAGRDEVDPVEIEAAVCGARYGQVAIVNRVKGSAEQGDAARVMFCGGALRLRGGQYASQEFVGLFSHKLRNGARRVL